MAQQSQSMKLEQADMVSDVLELERLSEDADDEQEASQALVNGQDNMPQRCLLLEMPAELRNRIYDYTFNRSTKYVGQNRSYDAPLLRTCRQIRNEASQIFYHKKFMLGLDAAQPQPQQNHWLWTKVAPNKIVVFFEGTVKYSAVKLCIKQFHSRGAGPRQIYDIDDDREVFLQQLFEIAQVMKVQSWDATEKALDLTKGCLDLADFSFDNEDE